MEDNMHKSGGAGGISLSPIFNGINFIASISSSPTFNGINSIASISVVPMALV